MAGYLVNIINNEGTIEISSKEENNEVTITSVDFCINTLDDKTRNNSDAKRVEIIIKGTINKGNKDNTLKLLKWAFDDDQNTLYRKVEIEVYSDAKMTGALLRRYEVNEMFVIDYKEKKSEEKNENMAFEMFLAQSDKSNELKVYSN